MVEDSEITIKEGTEWRVDWGGILGKKKWGSILRN